MIKKTNIKRVDGKATWRMPAKEARRIFTEDYDEEGQPLHYRDWLVARLGRPMERALIKAEHRYQRLKPAQIRASTLHAAYGRRR